MEWGQQPAHGGKGGQVEDSRSLPGNLEPQFSLSLLGNDPKAIMVHLHTEGVCTALSSCPRLEDEFLKA